MADKHPKFRASVQIELRAENEGDIDDLIHAVWEGGDPSDATDAVVWVTDIEPVPEQDAISEAQS